MRDPLSERLRRLVGEAGLSAERLAPALLGVREIFADDLPRDPRFAAPVTAALGSLIARGAAATVRAAIQ